MKGFLVIINKKKNIFPPTCMGQPIQNSTFFLGRFKLWNVSKTFLGLMKEFFSTSFLQKKD